jgi:IS30 family transposase
MKVPSSLLNAILHDQPKISDLNVNSIAQVRSRRRVAVANLELEDRPHVVDQRLEPGRYQADLPQPQVIGHLALSLTKPPGSTDIR